MDSFIFALNAIAPTCLIIAVGVVLRRLGVVNEEYVKRSSTVVFKVSLPLLLFSKLVSSDLHGMQLGLPVLMFLCISVLVFGAVWGVAHVTVADGRSRGALVQGSFRSNIAIIGLPILANMQMEAAVTYGVILLAAAMPVYNILSVVVLSITAGQGGKLRPGHILLNILKNPLIMAVLVGMFFFWLDWRLPRVLMTTVRSLAQLTFPLALLGIGASMRTQTFQAKARLILAGVLVKNVALPLVVMGAACLLGIRDEWLAVLFVVSAAPTAISSFIMAKAMGADAELAAGIVFATTWTALPVIGLGILLLRAAGIV